MNLKPKVCILTSSHRPNDERIFYKQAKSLAGAGYDVAVIAPHPADEVLEGIKIKAVPRAGSRLGRLLLSPFRLLAAGIRENADIYHFHDPELLPAGLALRLLGRKVIYDSHEYYRLKIMSKHRIPGGVRHLLAWAYDLAENLASRVLNGVIVVDGVTGGKFKGRAVRVGNFPFRPDKPAGRKARGGEFKCVYAGGLSADRGLFKMIEAMEHVDKRVRLVLAGPMSDEDLDKAKGLKGIEKVEYLGLIPWMKVLELLPECDLGLVLLQPVPAYIYAGENTVKLFEYMMSGLPTLASDFPNLKKILDQEACGLTVDPADPVEIAKKIMFFVDNPDAANRMGESGIKAVMEKYNWEKEEAALLGLYAGILNEGLMVGDGKAAA